MENYQKSGLDVLFYGQEHFDTLAILSMKDEFAEGKVADLMKNQKLFSNKELMIRNFGKLSVNLDECEEYIQKVIVRIFYAHLFRMVKSNQTPKSQRH